MNYRQQLSIESRMYSSVSTSIKKEISISENVRKARGVTSNGVIRHLISSINVISKGRNLKKQIVFLVVGPLKYLLYETGCT